MNRRGFTLIELLLSVSIIGILTGVSLPLYMSFNNRNDLDITTQGIAGALRRAQVYARGGKGDNQWGVRVQSTGATLFRGNTFASRDSTYDEVTTISPSTTVGGGLSEIVFAKLSGAPSTTGSITLTNINNELRTVTINAKGMVSY